MTERRSLRLRLPHGGSCLKFLQYVTEGSGKALSVSLLIDIAIPAVLLFSMAAGWKQGIVRGILNLVATVLALLIAARVGAVVSEIVVEQVIRPTVYEIVMDRVEEISLRDLVVSPLEGMEQVLEAIENDFVREEARKVLMTLSLSGETAEGLSKEVLTALSGEVLDAVLYGVVQEIISTLVCLISYVVLTIVLRPVVDLICKTFELPLLRQVNRLGGLAVGTVRGLILVLAAVWVLRLFGVWITEETIAESYLLPYLTDFLDSQNLPFSV